MCHKRPPPEADPAVPSGQKRAATFVAQTEAATGADLQPFVKYAFDAVLECGILAHGLLRPRSGACQERQWPNNGLFQFQSSLALVLSNPPALKVRGCLDRRCEQVARAFWDTVLPSDESGRLALLSYGTPIGLSSPMTPAARDDPALRRLRTADARAPAAAPTAQPVALGARAFDVLRCSRERPGRLVGKRMLMDLVWPGLVVQENNLAAQVSALRKVLGRAT